MSVDDICKRRRFIGVLGSVTSAGMLAGCLGQEESDDEDGQDSDTKYGGTLTTRVPAEISSLNPIMNTSGAGYAATSWLYSKLTRTDQNLEPYGDLARDWESNEASDEWTFHLREGATFNDNGDEVTAEDVKASIEAMHDPDVGSPGGETLPELEQVNVIDEYTVVIELNESDADVDMKLANRWAGILPKEVIENEDSFDDVQNNPVGSGAFELESFERGAEATFVRSDSWHLSSDDGEELPYVDEIVQDVIPEDTSFVNAVRQGEINVQGKDVPISTIDELEGMPNIEIHEVPSGRSYPIFMSPSSDVFAEQEVRHAIKYAIDKEAILNAAGRGFGVTGEDNFVSPVHRYYADLPDVFGSTSDIEAARDELESAGYTDGIEIDTPLIMSPEMAGEMEETAVIAQENCAEAGIEFEIESVSSDFWLSNVEGQGDFYVGVYGLRTVEDQILRQVLHSDGPWNYGFSNNEFDAAVDTAARTTDPEVREEEYARAQEIAQMNAGMCVPYFAASIGFTDSDVQNYEQDPTTLQVPVYDVWVSS